MSADGAATTAEPARVIVGVIVPCRDAERRVEQVIELARRSQPRLHKRQPIETKQDNQTVSCQRWVRAR
jgi:hypothetical protein